MKKAVFIDYKEGELEDKVHQRIADNFDETAFVMRDAGLLAPFTVPPQLWDRISLDIYITKEVSMAKKAKRHHASFKFKVALDSFVKGNVAQVARRYEINPNQLSTWRRRLLDQGEQIFQADQSQREKQLVAKITQLENLIGKKEIEISLLKKYLDFYAPPDGV